MEQNAAHVSRVILLAPSNAAESARPSFGSAQQDTKLYPPTDGRPVGFVVKLEVDSVVLVIKVEVENWDEVVADEEEVIKDMEEVVDEGIEEEVFGDVDVVEGEEDVVEAAEEFDDLSW